MTAATDIIWRLNIDADRLKLSKRADLHAICGDIREAAATLASLREEQDSWRRVAERLETEKQAAEASNEALRVALERIRDESEVHTKLNQERLCCKFQDIAAEALAALQAEGRGK